MFATGAAPAAAETSLTRLSYCATLLLMLLMLAPMVLQVKCQEATTSAVSWTPTVLRSFGDNLLGTDGGTNDPNFRNSGVVLDGEFYYAINGVHPISGSLTSSYPKSLVKAKLADDTVVTRWSFTASTVGRDVDLEGLTFGPEGTSAIYIGDEYNWIYRVDVTNSDVSTAVTGSWDCGAIVGRVPTDKGIESIAYNSNTGNFHIGIQETGRIHEVTLGTSTSTSAGSVTQSASFDIERSPSGMFYHAGKNVLWFDCGTTTLGDQYFYSYTTSGSKLCQITVPASAGFARTDGFFISADETKAYIADSQGDQHDSALGHLLYEVSWTDPCGIIEAGGDSTSATTASQVGGGTSGGDDSTSVTSTSQVGGGTSGGDDSTSVTTTSQVGAGGVTAASTTEGPMPADGSHGSSNLGGGIVVAAVLLAFSLSS